MLSRPYSVLLGLLLFAGVSAPSMHGQAAPLITRFTTNGTLVWTNVLLDHAYSIQATPVLGQTWSNVLSGIQATGTTMSVTVPMTNATGFYRVVDNGSCCSNNGGSSFAQALYLGMACGDGSPTVLQQFGCSNGWFRVRASECSSAQRELRVTVTLYPPPGTDYDLYTYYPNGTLRASSTNGGNTTEVVNIIVPDPLFTGTDETFDLWIEVRKWSGTGCGNWTLSVQVGW